MKKKLFLLLTVFCVPALLTKIKIAQIDSAVVSREIEDRIIFEMKKNNLSGGVVGLSGGIDSTLTAFLTKRAFDRHNSQVGQNELKLFALVMPSNSNQKADQLDGVRVAQLLGIEYKIINIQPILDSLLVVDSQTFANRFDLGNAASRVRMVLLYAHARPRNALVMGTGNADEDYCIGYFTKFGDGGVDCNPIGELSKRNVRNLARFVGVPEDLANRVPTAGLWAGQTDEAELGYSYNEVELVIAGFTQGLTADEICKETGIKLVIIQDIIKRHNITEHKRQLPWVPNITQKYE